jgi:hypothetical protein
MSISRIIALAALTAIIFAAAISVWPARKPTEACGDVFSRADTEWTKRCDFSK